MIEVDKKIKMLAKKQNKAVLFARIDTDKMKALKKLSKTKKITVQALVELALESLLEKVG